MKISNFQFSIKGFTFIDVLVGTALMLIIFLGISGAYQLGLKVVSQSKARISATALANQRVEEIRNLSYKEVGTTPHSVDEPEGSLPKTETISRNNIEHTVETTIKYINDCFDGPRSAECPEAPEIDDCVKDYKRAKVKVSWTTPFEGEVNLVTDVAPRNLNQEVEECTGAAAGVISVLVFNAEGTLVSSPLIEIIDPDTGNTLTAAQPVTGKYNFVLSPTTYKVEITKSGYSSNQTHQENDTYDGKTIAEPIKSHPSVYEGKLTEIGFSIDEVSSMTVQARGTKGRGYPPLHNVTFKMEGAKTVGNDSEGMPIYKYSQSHTTNGPGEINLSNLEWDSYSFYVDSPDYELIGIESPPGVETSQPIDIFPASSQEVRLILKAENTLLVKVQDVLTTEPIFMASVRLSYSGLEYQYDQTQPTNEEGETFFLPLEEVIYDLEVRAGGYETYTGQVSVSGDTTFENNPDANILLNLLP